MESLNDAVYMIGEQLEDGSTVWYILFGVLLALAVFFFVRGIYVHSRRSVESKSFMVFCIPIMVWAFLFLTEIFFNAYREEGTWIYLGIVAVGFLIPPLLMLHIWSQVSYRPITRKILIIWLAAPIALIAIETLKNIDPWYWLDVDVFDLVPLETLIWNVFFVVVMVRAYLLCFNVLYQMPRHMRRSTYHMIGAITAVVLARGLEVYFSFPENLVHVANAVSYIIAIPMLFTAFFIANSSNVIVTSREFVYSNLSTIVITVSLKGNILDWNHREKDRSHPLPKPTYKEPYPAYRKRIIETMGGTVSPYDENILCLKSNDREYHLMFTWHDISYLGRRFGYLVEISEVTKSYSKLRYIEAIAYQDTLTGLYNRNSYIEQVKQMSVPENMPLLIVVGDVNNLKKVNDTHGHLLGDKLLMMVSKAVKEKAPERAFVARIGGDEIVMLLPRAKAGDAERFISGVNSLLEMVNDPKIGMPSLSWGHSLLRNATDEYNEAFRVADAIMYEAKKKMNEVSRSGVVPATLPKRKE